jgi:hypothetical protein
MCVIWAGVLLLLAALFTAYGKSSRKPIKRARWLLIGLGILVLSMSAVTCNDLYYRNNISPAPVGTPAGDFTLTLIGTLGSKTTVTRSTTVELSVEPSP